MFAQRTAVRRHRSRAATPSRLPRRTRRRKSGPSMTSTCENGFRKVRAHFLTLAVLTLPPFITKKDGQFRPAASDAMRSGLAGVTTDIVGRSRMFPETTPALANVLHWASRPTDDAETRRLIRRRLIVYVRLVGTLFGALYLLGWLSLIFIAPDQLLTVHLHPGKIINLLLMIGAFALLFFLRRWEPTERALRVVDAGFPFLLATGIGCGSATAPRGYHFEI